MWKISEDCNYWSTGQLVDWSNDKRYEMLYVIRKRSAYNYDKEPVGRMVLRSGFIRNLILITLSRLSRFFLNSYHIDILHLTDLHVMKTLPQSQSDGVKTRCLKRPKKLLRLSKLERDNTPPLSFLVCALLPSVVRT